ncbi:hypothetical protein BD769DRAFT_1421887 [Suillus cothurnatus]|nr:hypothetical protein BD769DRAFT_1421887 [Suillus cothurnatus]
MALANPGDLSHEWTYEKLYLVFSALASIVGLATAYPTQEAPQAGVAKRSSEKREELDSDLFVYAYKKREELDSDLYFYNYKKREDDLN